MLKDIFKKDVGKIKIGCTSFMPRYLRSYSMARELLSLSLSLSLSYLLYLEKFLQETPVSQADQLLIKNPNAGYMRPLGFLFSDCNYSGSRFKSSRFKVRER